MDYYSSNLPSKSSDVMPRDSYASKMSLFSTFSVLIYGYSNDDNDEFELELWDSGFLFEEADSINDGIWSVCVNKNNLLNREGSIY